MKIYLLFAFTILSLSSYSQLDSTKIYNCKHLKRGFYKNYKEFINNNPSRVTDFIVTPLVKSKTDTTVMGAEYELVDSVLTKYNHVWGFCDGTNVYVDYSGTFSSTQYWKLLELGPIAFFSCKVKDMVMLGGPLMMIATGVLSASLPVEYELKRINENGKIRDLGVEETSDLLKGQPILLKEFYAKTDRHLKLDADPRRNKNLPPLTDAEYQKQQDTIVEYLTKLNDTLKKH